MGIQASKGGKIILAFCHCSALVKFVNKAADGGITALHMAALNGYADCVQLLLDLHANTSAVTFHYGTSMDLIGMSVVRDLNIIVYHETFWVIGFAFKN